MAFLTTSSLHADYNAVDLQQTYGLSPTAFNSTGQFVGSKDFGSGNTAFVFTPAGGYISLGTLGGFTSSASAISNNGYVVGQSDVSPTNFNSQAFLWTPGSGITALGTLGGNNSSAAAVNKLGWVVGNSDIKPGSFDQNAFLWTPYGRTNLGTLGGNNSYATGINNLGFPVGFSDTSTPGQTHAFVWVPATISTPAIIDLGTFGGNNSRADAINDRNQVVGVASHADGSTTAFLWTTAGGMTDLGTLGGQNSFATSINSNGTVVGAAEDVGGTLRAFVWDPVNGMQDLNNLINGGNQGRNLTGAFAINDLGQILTIDTQIDSGSAVLLTPSGNGGLPESVPAPAGIGLGFMAISILALRIRRRFS